MAGSILFVLEGKNFLVSAICNSLEKAGYTTHTASFASDDYATYAPKADMFFFLIGDDDTVVPDASSLSGIENKKVFILGNAEQADNFASSLKGCKSKSCFYKPANAKDIVAAIMDGEEKTSDSSAMKRILVVDDSGTFLHTIKSWLSPIYNVTVVNSAAMGLSFLGKNKPDLILLDYEMPECSGPEMLEKLRADEKLSTIPVIFLTGKGDRDSITQVLSYKPQGYLLKSYPKEKIVESIAEFFGNK